jgi:2-oxo-hept-3-ene-1,7-dioate hydratase
MLELEPTLTPGQVVDLARAHDEARRTVVPIDPVTRHHPDVNLADAYAVQAAWIDLQVHAGATVRGRKIGLTSRAMQMAMHIDEPDFGTLLDDMFIEPGATIAAADFLDPKIEVEFAFVLARRLDRPGVTVADVWAATDHVVPALELIDARSYRVHPDDGRTRTVRDTISDNAANAGIVVGHHHISPNDVASGRVDLRWAGAICKRNGIVEETGLGAGVLDDPAIGIVWLADRLIGLGMPLDAGETVLAGSFTRPVDCRSGDEFSVDFGPLGSIDLGVD